MDRKRITWRAVAIQGFTWVIIKQGFKKNFAFILNLCSGALSKFFPKQFTLLDHGTSQIGQLLCYLYYFPPFYSFMSANHISFLKYEIHLVTMIGCFFLCYIKEELCMIWFYPMMQNLPYYSLVSHFSFPPFPLFLFLFYFIPLGEILLW